MWTGEVIELNSILTTVPRVPPSMKCDGAPPIMMRLAQLTTEEAAPVISGAKYTCEVVVQPSVVMSSDAAEKLVLE